MGAPFTVELHAAGLGLMLYSPCVEALLEDGRDYMPPGKCLVSPLREMVERDQQVVFLGTGSPQLDYMVHVELGEPRSELARQAPARVRFGLDIAGGTLCVRDGYDPMEWHSAGESVHRVPMGDGYHVVDALWIPDDPDRMTIHLCFCRADERISGDGWPYLPFRVIDA